MSDSCDPHIYKNVDKAHRDMLMSELGKAGATVTGSNPYDVDTHKSGVKLRAVYDEPGQTLTVSITDKPSVPFMDVCAKVWGSIDPAVNKVLSTPIITDKSDPDAAGALGKIGANSGGELAGADRDAFKASIGSLDNLQVAAKPKFGINKSVLATVATPNASASGSGPVQWLVAHPLVAVAAVAALGVGGYLLVKRS